MFQPIILIPMDNYSPATIYFSQINPLSPVFSKLQGSAISALLDNNRLDSSMTSGRMFSLRNYVGMILEELRYSLKSLKQDVAKDQINLESFLVNSSHTIKQLAQQIQNKQVSTKIEVQTFDKQIMEWKLKSQGLTQQNNKLKMLLSQNILNNSVEIDKFKKENQNILEENFVLKQTVLTLESELKTEKQNNREGRRDQGLIQEFTRKIQQLKWTLKQKQKTIYYLQNGLAKQNVNRYSEVSDILPLQSCLENLHNQVKQKDSIHNSWKGRPEERTMNVFVPKIALGHQCHYSFENTNKCMPYTPRQNTRTFANNNFGSVRRNEQSPISQYKPKTDRLRLATSPSSTTSPRGNFIGNLMSSYKNQRSNQSRRCEYQPTKQLKIQSSKMSKINLSKIQEQLEGLANEMKLQFKYSNRMK